ncbi:protein RST1-like [Ananas comosus]|uniref:Protein RST1-like n=1 Tax=Ananas comosus TaxID=4615 RepID=A0A6P5EH96_ANACO|nr:protein RST1-like [Ananas comosus]
MSGFLLLRGSCIKELKMLIQFDRSVFDGGIPFYRIICRIAAESIPRVAVNIAFVIGALCMAVPPTAHLVVSAASDFLLKWLFEYEHEHRQWSAAISLGLISNCFHPTDKKQKFNVINGLLKVICSSESHLVRGACGVGLGYACQDLLTRVESASDSSPEGTMRFDEAALLDNIVGTLSVLICQLCPSVSGPFRDLGESFPLDKYGINTSEGSLEDNDNLDLEEDAWGVAGLVYGLAHSVSALYKVGAYDAVIKIKRMLTSWLPYVDMPDQISIWFDETTKIPLYIGSCLALPYVVAFCQRVELIDDDDLNVLFNRYTFLVSELLKFKKSGTAYQNLLLASCVGVGSLLSCILNDGVHSLRLDDVKCLLDTFRCIYSNPYPPLVHLAGMFGVVNAFGAGAGDLTNTCSQPINLQTNYEQEASFIRGPILACPACETLSTSLVQEIFLVSKDSKDQAMQNFAAWAISFLRNRLWPMESDGVNGSQSSSISQSFPEDALVLKLSLWLRDINSDKTGNRIHATTVATVLRCLSKAPRLPPLDWGAIIRRCMRYEAYFPDLSVEHIPMLLREESLYFSLSHASQISPLLHFLDDLTDLSRFRTLEPRLQSVVLENLSDLLKLFSGSRLEKLYEDLFEYFSSSTSSYLVYEPEQRSTLRMSIWKGLRKCLTEDFKGSDGFGNMERCMECLLSLLPISMSDSRQDGVEEEWSCAINCLGAAPHNWLVDKLQVPTSHVGGDSDEIGKRIVVKARLTRIGCISPSELGKLKAYIFNARSKGRVQCLMLSCIW